MSETYKFLCGAGKADITPPLGTKLYGYAPARPAESVGDPIATTAIKVVSNEESALLITCDIASLNPEFAVRARKLAGDAAGVKPENVIINVTHTHSAPNCSLKSGWGDVEIEYIENILFPGIVKASTEAAETCRPALMGIGEIESNVNMNRRELTEEGKIVLGQNPWGPRDPRMTVLSFKDEEGNIIANFIHFACHGTAAGRNPEITRDWYGVMTDMLDLETGGISAFYQGFEGDLGPNCPNGRTTQNYKTAIRIGGQAGMDAVRAWRSIKEWRKFPVKVLHDTISIPFDPLASKEKAEEELAKLDAIYGEGSTVEVGDYARHAAENDYIHWRNVLAEYASGEPLKTHFNFEQSIVTIGPVAILPAPFEVFCEIGLRIRRGSPYPYTLNLCNTHGCFAYLPTQSDIARGGYEVWHFLLAMRTTYPLPKNTDDWWVRQNLAILREEEVPTEEKEVDKLDKGGNS